MTTAATNLAHDPDDGTARVEDFEMFMRPIVKILLMFRVSMPAFIALVKKLYLEEAKKALKRREQDVSVPRLAFEAGCTDIGLVSDFIKGRRNTIADIGDLPQSGNDQDGVPLLSLEAIILDRWRSDPMYQDQHGKPVTLPVRGPAGRSFDGLVRRCVSGRMSYGPILETLRRTNAIEHDSDTDQVTLITRRPRSDRDRPGADSSADPATEFAFLTPTNRDIKARIGGKELNAGRQDRRSLSSLLATSVRGIAHLASTCFDNLWLAAKDSPDRDILARTQQEFFAIRIPADKYWEFKSRTREMMLEAIEGWAAWAQEEIETTVGPHHLTAGIGYYFWDLRPDVYDTQDIGMPELIPPEQES